jgi:hypothetical protein
MAGGGGMPSSTSSKGFLLTHTTATSTILTGPKRNAPSSGSEMILATSDEAAGIVETLPESLPTPTATHLTSGGSIMHPPLHGRLKISDLPIFQLLKAFKLQQYAIVSVSFRDIISFRN